MTTEPTETDIPATDSTAFESTETGATVPEPPTEPAATDIPVTDSTASEPAEVGATVPEPPHHPVAYEMTRESQNWAMTAHLSASFNSWASPRFSDP